MYHGFLPLTISHMPLKEVKLLDSRTFLLSKGVDPCVTTSLGRTAEQMAMEADKESHLLGCSACVRALEGPFQL